MSAASAVGFDKMCLMGGNGDEGTHPNVSKRSRTSDALSSIVDMPRFSCLVTPWRSKVMNIRNFVDCQTLSFEESYSI